jgi:hypothetical protein
MTSVQLTHSADGFKHFTIGYHAATLFSLHDPKSSDMYISMLEGTMQRFSLKHGYGNISMMPFCHDSNNDTNEDYTCIGQFIGHVLSNGETKFNNDTNVFDKYENMSFGIDAVGEYKVPSDLINPDKPQPFSFALVDFFFQWNAKDTGEMMTHRRQIKFNKISATQFAAK